jgi:hypothetical protein
MISLKTFLPYYMIAGMLLLFANVVWAFKDARQRGRSGVLIAMLVLWTFPLGVVLWLYLRPELLSERPHDADSADADADIKKRANAGLL